MRRLFLFIIIISIWTLIGCDEIVTASPTVPIEVTFFTPELTPSETPYIFQTPTPISTAGAPTPIVVTPLGQHHFPYKSKALVQYIPRGNWLIRRCYIPVLDNDFCPPIPSKYVVANTPVYVFCIAVMSEEEQWGGITSGCMTNVSVNWFVIKLSNEWWSDEVIEPNLLRNFTNYLTH